MWAEAPGSLNSGQQNVLLSNWTCWVYSPTSQLNVYFSVSSSSPSPSSSSSSSPSSSFSPGSSTQSRPPQMRSWGGGGGGGGGAADEEACWVFRPSVSLSSRVGGPKDVIEMAEADWLTGETGAWSSTCADTLTTTPCSFRLLWVESGACSSQSTGSALPAVPDRTSGSTHRDRR